MTPTIVNDTTIPSNLMAKDSKVPPLETFHMDLFLAPNMVNDHISTISISLANDSLKDWHITKCPVGKGLMGDKA